MSDQQGALKSGFDFVKAEEKILQFWKEKQIFEKSVEQNKNSSQGRYVFYDGPPFATGLPHHGHLVASTIKDVIPRYYTMRGHYVPRGWGWDCHGLPIEQQIDHKFQMSANDYVEKNGIKAYCDACREIVMTYLSQWKSTIERIGRWCDFDQSYKTMDLDFMESVWWVFKQVYDKGLIYKGNKIVPYSTALETGLSNFEATQNYQDVQDPTLTVLFKLIDEDAYLSAWTTTPWTLPSNLGLIVNESMQYELIKDLETGKHIYLASSRVEAYEKRKKIERTHQTLLGKELVGRSYEPLFPYFKELKEKGAFKVFSDDYVQDGDGTGIVHAAPAFGEDDHRVLKTHGMHEVALPLNSKGEFTSEVSDFSGLYIKDADKLISKHLKQEGKIWDQDVLVHSYPFCYRTDTPLIYRALPQWYLNVEQIKDKMIQANSEINWTPEHIKEGRFGKWIENARDWAISRNRYWGTPLPIWENETSGKTICIGSVEELERYSGVKVSDLHREVVDELTFSIEGEEGVYKRIPEVFDCWFESGSMPYASIHYPFENTDEFKFPADFIAEGLDQTRGWFYTLTVLSAALFDKPAFKNVIVNGLVLASDGKKMSKRLKNYTMPDILMNEFGADALRLTLINSALVKGEELRFSDELLKEMTRKALLPWYNAFSFFSTYAKVDGWTYKASNLSSQSTHILDQWILSQLETLTDHINQQMSEYKLYKVVPELFQTIDALTNWYIRLNRRRFWEGKGISEDKNHAYSTLFKCLLTLSKLMAPFTPFLSEHLYQELKAFDSEKLLESVHLEAYPQSNLSQMNSRLEKAFEIMQDIIVQVRQKRNQIKVKIKTPLSEMLVVEKDEALLEELKVLAPIMQSELNIKEIKFESRIDDFIELKALPNSPVLGKKLGKEFGRARGLIQKLSSEQIQQFLKENKLQLTDSILLESDDLLVSRTPTSNQKDLLVSDLSVLKLNTELNDELINEGLAREILSFIQKTRKDIDFKVEDRIKVDLVLSDGLKEKIAPHIEHIKKESLCDELNFLDSIDEEHAQVIIDKSEIKIKAQKNI